MSDFTPTTRLVLAVTADLNVSPLSHIDGAIYPVNMHFPPMGGKLSQQSIKLCCACGLAPLARWVHDGWQDVEVTVSGFTVVGDKSGLIVGFTVVGDKSGLTVGFTGVDEVS